MSLRPAVSVIMPCHNAARTVRAAVASIAAQTLDCWELICIDDGSTDETPTILNELARGEARMRVLRAHAGGASAARNVGVRAARGAHTFFLDADDRIEPRALTLLLETAQSAGRPTLVTAGLDLLDAEGFSLGAPRFLTVPDFTIDGLLRGNNIVGVMVLVRTELLGPRPFDESLPSNEDWDLWLRLAARGAACVVVPRVLLGYRLQSVSLSRRFDERHAAAQRVVRRWLPHAADVRAVADAPLRVAVACGTLAMAAGDDGALERYWRHAGDVCGHSALATAAMAEITAHGLCWAWQFARGAFGETWATHGDAWIATSADWLDCTPFAHVAQDILHRLNEIVRAPAVRRARITEWLGSGGEIGELVVYGVGTNGQTLLHELRAYPSFSGMRVAIADDHATDEMIAALELPRVDPRAWRFWPTGTRVIVTPNNAVMMQEALVRAGGRREEEFVVWGDMSGEAKCAAAVGAVS